jgi:transcription elongation factor SPT6
METDMNNVAASIDTIQGVYGDELIPLLYEKSKVSETQLVGQPEMVRRAVALGRGVQNPLASLAALCGPGREVGLLRLHSMQGLVTRDELWEAVERVMMTITTQVRISPLESCSLRKEKLGVS